MNKFQTNKNLKEDYLVSVSWLKENFSNKNLIILDARGNEEQYLENHIKGSKLISWESLCNTEGSPSTNPKWGLIKDIKEIELQLKELGINNDSCIIIYTTSLDSWGEEGRVLWTLKTVGLKNVKVLDGGFVKWKEKLGETSNSLSPESCGNVTLNSFDSELNISTDNLSQELNNYSLIDTRELEEYEGKKTYGEAREGRIPKSINLYFKDLYNTDGTFVSKDNLQKILIEKNIDLNKVIITYCTGGIRSSVVWMILNIYGYKSKNYDASFAGWTINPKLPIITKTL